MKKKFWLLAVAGILAVVLAVPMAFGTSDANDQMDNQLQQMNKMLDNKQEYLDRALKDGSITPEQAKVWQDHINYMRDFHSKNGMGFMCQINGEGMGPMGHMNGKGMGHMGRMGNCPNAQDKSAETIN
jgi:hypothetical protein